MFGIAKELRAPPSPPPTPPGVGGWGTTAGASPRPLPGAACGQAACTADAPMWCDRRSRTGQEGRYTIGGQPPGSSAPGIPDAEAAVGELVKKTYIIHGSWPEIKLERSKNGAACVTCLVLRGLRPRGKGSKDTVNEAHGFKQPRTRVTMRLFTRSRRVRYRIRNGRRPAASQSLGIRG